MSNTIHKLRSIIQNNPNLLWYTNDYESLDEKAIVEAILSHGTWEQVQTLITILGFPTLNKTFINLTSNIRANFRPATENYFSHYLSAHA